MSKSKDPVIFKEIYRPKTIEELKLPVRITSLIESELNKFMTVPTYQMRMLFHGTAGLGKTTLASIIRVITGAETKFLSGSNEFNTSTMDNVVTPFCTTFANVTGKRKILIVDEFERMAPKLQDSFKHLTDKTLTGIIMITNHIDDVIPPIIDRARETGGGLIDFNFKGSEMVEQRNNYARILIRVCKENNIQFDSNAMLTLVNRSFPSYRAGMGMLQSFHDTGEPITLENMEHLTVEGVADIDLYQALRTIDDADFFTKMSEYKGREYDTFQSLCNPFFAWLNSQNLHKKTIQASIIVGNWGNRMGNSPNKWVALFACMSELRVLLMK